MRTNSAVTSVEYNIRPSDDPFTLYLLYMTIRHGPEELVFEIRVGHHWMPADVDAAINRNIATYFSAIMYHADIRSWIKEQHLKQQDEQC
ncbi:hypothetical protein [Achromobacter phage Motura]|uniref:Uncharacterized protein n=1 Tax=Achromobacter phage Motura TaxID=2591403 RepID=A0A514CSD8_9CAUD|nr:hypothetical protein H1O15_gp076 [Achromobacter phage Motura]QDH83387.1 hypothetical protein [Achromobacter phage Motura]